MPPLNNGALRVTNSAAVANISGATIAGGSSGADSFARIELANSVTLGSTSTTVTLQGRQPLASVPVHLESVDGSNTVPGTVTLTTGGNTYVIQSDSGSTLTFSNASAIINNTGGTTARFLYMQGAGNAVVNGVVGSGTGTGPMNIIKSGTGTWTLNGVNTYPGNTTINGGTLALGSLSGVPATIAASPVISVNTGATLDVSGTGVGITLAAAQTLGGSGTVNGNVADAATSTLAPGNTYNVGTLTLNNNLTLAGGDNIDYNVGGAAADKLTVGGTMTFNTGATNINFNPTAPVTAGTYTVASATNPLVGAVGNLAIVNNTRYTVNNLTVNPNTVTLDVSGANAQLVWNSTTSGDNWATSAVWKNGATPNDSFKQADDVVFDDTATNQTVALSTTVVPMSVTVNGTKSYTISGAGKISGATGLTQNSSGTTTISTTNDYFGTTKVTAGTLLVSGSVGPNSPVLITGGFLKLSNNLALGDNTVIATAPTTIDGGTTASPGGTLDVNNTANNALRFERIFVKGVGVGGNGAIVNNNTAAGSTGGILDYITMQGDTTFGGTSNGTTQDSGRFEIGRVVQGQSGPAFLAGNGFTLTKAGSNNLWLINLGYTNLGAVVINQGELTIQNDNTVWGTVLGNSSGFLAPITVNAGITTAPGVFSSWGLGSKINNNITLNGGGIGGTQPDTNGPLEFAGTITLNGGGVIYNANTGNNRQVILSGKITGTGDLTKPANAVIRGNATLINNDGGTIYFSGSVSNDYTGATIINGGATSNSFLRLQKSGGAIAIPHNLTIAPAANGTTVSLDAPNKLPTRELSLSSVLPVIRPTWT